MSSRTERSVGLVTALVPVIGYDAAAKIALEALQSGRKVRDLARERAGLTEAQLDDLLDPRKMTHPRAIPEITKR